MKITLNPPPHSPTPQSGGGYSRAFALPTLVVTATILMIAAVSVAQTTVSIATSLRSQSYNHLADEAAQAGVSYAYSCLKKNGTNYWGNPLKPSTSCAGTSNGASTYIEDKAASGDNPHYRSSFSVATPTSVSNQTTAKVTGQVELVDSSGTITKTWVSDKVVVVSLPGGALTAKKAQTSGATTCVIASDDQAYCSGYNNYGQLGDKTTQNHATAVKFQLASGLSAVDMLVKGSYTCILASDQQLYCAGYNGSGNLGNGTLNNATTSLAKFTLPAGVGVREIPKTTRNDAVCVIATNERLYCAGINQYGEFGNGGTTYSQPTPTPFCGSGCSNTDLNGSHTKIISADVGGFGNICVVTHDITGGVYNYAYCAGNNGSGRLGDNTTTSRSSPILFPTGQPQINQVYSNNAVTCAVSYVVYCAGYNDGGQVADGTTTTRMTPVVAFGSSLGALKVYTYYTSTCAIFISTEMWCTGSNDYGKLGNGTTTYKQIPMARFLVSGGGIKDVDIGTISICALTTNGEIYCAGYNGRGNFGNGNTTNTATPVKFNTPGNSKIPYSWSFTDTDVCGVAADGNAYCAGGNEYGQLSDGTTTNRSTPVKFQLPST